MVIQQRIEQKLTDAFSPLYLEVMNESYMHNVPEGAESHFKVVIVSNAFDDKRLIARHRAVNQVLSDELAHHIHALGIHTYTKQEWSKVSEAIPNSPRCLGGNKK